MVENPGLKEKKASLTPTTLSRAKLKCQISGESKGSVLHTYLPKEIKRLVANSVVRKRLRV